MKEKEKAAISVSDPTYTRGSYFENPERGSEDTRFKAENFLTLLKRYSMRNKLTIRSYADVGCGSGRIVKYVADALELSGYEFHKVKGYDVSPHVRYLKKDGIEYIHGDFREEGDFFDLVTLFDVVEHVPDTIEFIKQVSERCNFIGIHLPLEKSINIALRDQFRSRLTDPGHLIYLDISSALNLLAYAGLRVVDYEYTYGFHAPSGHPSILSRLAIPLKRVLAGISPWLLSKTLGGVSLQVLAITKNGLERKTASRD